MNRTTIEELLDAGRLQVLCGCHWYDARRGGKTKTWKTRPHDFSIPIKVGFKTCGRIEPQDVRLNMLREKPQWNHELTRKGNLDVQRGRVGA